MNQKKARDIAPFEGYETPLCLPQLNSLLQGIAAMRKGLGQVRCPLLLMYAVNDRVCPPENALRIAQDAASEHISTRWLRMQENVTSHHMLTTHRETRKITAAAVADFVQQRIDLPA